jgi:hypothetical protein
VRDVVLHWKWEGLAGAPHCYLNIFSTRSYCFFIQNYSNARVYLWRLCVEEPGIKQERADLHINHENEEIKSDTALYLSVLCFKLNLITFTLYDLWIVDRL